MAPEEGVTRYFSDRDDELSAETKRNYSYQLKAFTNWCEEAGVTNLNQLTGKKIQEFKQWRMESVKPVTLKNDMWTVKTFMQFCEHINVSQRVSIGRYASRVSTTKTRSRTIASPARRHASSAPISKNTSMPPSAT